MSDHVALARLTVEGDPPTDPVAMGDWWARWFAAWPELLDLEDWWTAGDDAAMIGIAHSLYRPLTQMYRRREDLPLEISSAGIDLHPLIFWLPDTPYWRQFVAGARAVREEVRQDLAALAALLS